MQVQRIRPTLPPRRSGQPKYRVARPAARADTSVVDAVSGRLNRMSAQPEAWPAPTATASVRGVVRLPGSKSLTNRLLVLAALGDGVSRLRWPLRARDTELMA